MSYKILVARYNEDIDWLKDEMHNCVIYNKGQALNIENEFMLENLGRESDSYLNYIINNYDNLPDVVVFTQARISDHYIGGNDINYLLKLKDEALIYGKSQNSHGHTDVGNEPSFDHNWNLRIDGWFLKDNYKDNRPLLFLYWFNKMIKSEYPNPIFFYGNGIFAVRKELILKHPIEYYKELVLEVNHHINSTEGHFFERSWYYIFE
jgi:hypothetical protein